MIPKKLVCVEDFHQYAQTKLSSPHYGFVAGGANTEATLRRNQKAFSVFKLKQRVLMGELQKSFDFSTCLFGKKMACPLGVSPTGMNGIAWPKADEVLMQAA